MTATDPIERARQTMERMDRNQDGVLQADESRFLRGMATQADSNRDGVLSRSELETNFASNPMPGGGERGGGRGGNDQSSDEGGRGRRGRNNDEQNNDGNSGGRGNENANQRNREQINDSSRQGNDSNRRNREQQGGGEKKEPEVAKTLPSLLTGSYRIKPAKDGLPKELPSWFTALVASRDANADGQLSMNEYASRFTERVAAEFTRRDANNDGVITPDEALKSR
jgi:hypothetical protein